MTPNLILGLNHMHFGQTQDGFLFEAVFIATVKSGSAWHHDISACVCVCVDKNTSSL